MILVLWQWKFSFSLNDLFQGNNNFGKNEPKENKDGTKKNMMIVLGLFSF